MKRVAKGLLLFIANSSYVWLLFLSFTTVSAFLTLRNPDTIKQWLRDSGVYSSIVEETSKLATIQQKQENSLIQITSKEIEAAAQQAFTPETMRSDGEKVIDGFYGWFRGDTSGPQFDVDFSGRQATFAAIMTANLESKIDELPECTSTGRFTIQAFDPFKADCRPKDIDLTEELSSFQQELAQSKDILPQVNYTGEDVKVHQGDQEVSIATAWPWVPRAYKALVYGPWVVVLLTLLSGITLIIMSSSRRKGWRRFASGLVFTGVIMVLSGLFLRPAFERLNNWSTKSLGGQASFTQNVIDPIFAEINKTYSRYSVIFGVGYLIPAVIVYAGLLLTRHRHKHAEEGGLPETITENAQLDMHPVSQVAEAAPGESAAMNTAQTPTPSLSPEQPQEARLQTDPSPQAPLPEAPAPIPAQRPVDDSLRSGRVFNRRPPRIQG